MTALNEPGINDVSLTKAVIAASRTYIGLRFYVGLIGMLLPLVLLVGGLAWYGEVRRTISSYYYTGLRDWFVGALFVIAVFLFRDNAPISRGTSSFPCSRYNWTGNTAGLAAILVAVCPTVPAGDAPNWVATVHVLASVGFFGCLIYFSIYLFRHDGAEPGWQSEFHLMCGCLMTAMVVLAVIGASRGGNIFWFESIAIGAFAASWLVKGIQTQHALAAPAPG